MKVVLDREGDVDLLPGYRLIQTEVEFLRYADASEAIFVRGVYLCEWAELFYRARRIPFQYLRSPIHELLGLCPNLTKAEAEEIHRLLGSGYAELSRPFSVQDVLAKLYPQRMWQDAPSWQHGAAWVHWLASHPIPASVQPLLASVAEQWRANSTGPCSLAYTADNKTDAINLLLAWVGAADTKLVFGGGEFPFSLPTELIIQLRSKWNREIVTSRGAATGELLRKPMPHSLKLEAATVAATYFRQNPTLFTSQYLNQMQPYLDAKQQNELRGFVAQEIPGPMPATPSDVLHWYRHRYLPYRMWQEKNGGDDARQVAQEAAEQFIYWYLEEYPKGLLGGSLKSYLSFEYAMRLVAPDQSYTTLVVILDGLHVDDGEYMLQRLRNGTERLTVAQELLAFTALPTVTEFCKDALIKGTAPVHAPHYRPLGKEISESSSPIDHLQTAVPGEIYLWLVQEPDNTYHFRNGHQMLRRDIESRLDGITQKIVDVVNGVRPEVPLKIIVTTDHGRLLAEAQRTQAVPGEMKAHGRAAWGTSEREFPAAGYMIKEKIVFLHRERFGLPTDAAIVLGEEMFRTNDDRTGKEIYPHGGLYPEEVIVPWWVFLRDAAEPVVEIHLSGRGRAGQQATAEVHVQNLSAREVQIIGLHLALSGGRKIESTYNLICPPLHESRFSIQFDSWPTTQELQQILCQVEVQLAGNRRMNIAAAAALSSEEMYTRNENLLEGLDL